MYSTKLSKLFESKKIELGDMIKIETKNTVFEGELMPKTEAGDENTIVIKLKSGYNIGVDSEGADVTKIASRKVQPFPMAKPKTGKGLPKVSVLWTGGTIGSKVDYKTGGVNVEVKAEELFYYVPELPNTANIELKLLFSIYSEDMSYVEWQKIAEEAAKELNKGMRGIVIAHGTDTMHYTAAALSFMLGNLNAPVVLTGSQRSSDRGSSDAFLNLSAATSFAAKSDIAEVGICMHATSSDDKMSFIRGVKARKMHTSRRDAFRPINDKPIAYSNQNGDISYTKNEYKKIGSGKEKIDLKTKFDPKTALIKIYPNSDPEILEHIVGKGAKGVILEGTGLGHVPVSTTNAGKSWLPHIKKAVDGGVVIGITSQTLYGRVNENVYRNLRLISGAGAVYCEDMLPEVAYVKLGWLLGNHNQEKAKELLNKNIVGEIKKRIEFDEFLV